MNEAGAAVAPDAGELADPGVLSLPYGMEIDIRQQTIKEHWLPVLSNVLMKATHDDEMGLAEWETEIWAPAITGLANRYIPELLKATDKPEWAMLGLAVVTYAGVRVHKFGPIKRLLGRNSSDHATPTPVSRESQAFSEVPAPGKPTELPSSLQVAPESSGLTQ